MGLEEPNDWIPSEILEEEDNKYPEKKSRSRIILYNFHKKKMATRIPTMQSSAAPDGEKVATCALEVIRM